MNHPSPKSLLAFITLILTVLIVVVSSANTAQSTVTPAQRGDKSISSWTHLSTVNGDLDLPSGSSQQTASLILDIDVDGLNDLVVGARQGPGPSLVWYQRQTGGWRRFVIDNEVLNIEAGGAYHDIDQDGDLDIVMGGDSQSNQVWWWENPYPNFDPDTGWNRHLIKDSGAAKHHDQMFGDFDGDGRMELVFWNQGAKRLILAEIPDNPRASASWPQTVIYTWLSGSEHEGLARADVDRDGLVDIVGGGHWFKYEGDRRFTAYLIAANQTFSRVAAGQLKQGGPPEVVFLVGDGAGRLLWYEWNGRQWRGTDLLGYDVDHGHSLQLGDVDRDGNLDIFMAEMRLDGGNQDAEMLIFFGDGKGNFTSSEVVAGYGNHESRLGDLDGDGDLDILGKPYNWQTPRLDIWLNESSCEPSLDQWQRHVIDAERPAQSIFIFPADLDHDGLQDIVTGAWWYRNPGTPSGTWIRLPIGDPLNNVAAVYDFDGDGFLDLLGTEGVGSASNADLVWAHNDGSGNFTIRDNIARAQGDFLQGVAVDDFVANLTEVALSWHQADMGVQSLIVPADPLNTAWTWRQISAVSQDEALSSGDIDRDGDRDLLLGTKWLRNDAAGGPDSGPWSVHDLFQGGGDPDRNRLVDINGDGDLDAVVGYEAISSPGKLAWYEQPDNPTAVWTEHLIAADVIGPMSLDVADMDGDADLDVVVGEHDMVNPEAARLLVYENPGTQGDTWAAHVISTGDEHHDGAQIVDIDNDGDLDVLSIGWSHSRVLLYENQSCIGGQVPPGGRQSP